MPNSYHNSVGKLTIYGKLMVVTFPANLYIIVKMTARLSRRGMIKMEETTMFTFFFGPVSKGLALAQGITFLAGPGNWHASALLGLINICIPF